MKNHVLSALLGSLIACTASSSFADTVYQSNVVDKSVTNVQNFNNGSGSVSQKGATVNSVNMSAQTSTNSGGNSQGGSQAAKTALDEAFNAPLPAFNSGTAKATQAKQGTASSSSKPAATSTGTSTVSSGAKISQYSSSSSTVNGVTKTTTSSSCSPAPCTAPTAANMPKITMPKVTMPAMPSIKVGN